MPAPTHSAFMLARLQLSLLDLRHRVDDAGPLGALGLAQHLHVLDVGALQILVDPALGIEGPVGAAGVEDARRFGVLQLEHDEGGLLPGAGELGDGVATERQGVGDALRDATERAVVGEG